MSETNGKQGKPPEESASPGNAVNPTPKKKTGGKHPPTPGVGSPAARRQARIRELKARLLREQSRFNSQTRKECNRQLFVFGAMVERAYKAGTDGQRRTVAEWIEVFLTDDQHRIRARDGLERIDAERSEPDE